MADALGAPDALAVDVARTWLCVRDDADEVSPPVDLDRSSVRRIVDQRMTNIALVLADENVVDCTVDGRMALEEHSLLAAQRAVALESLCAALIEELDSEGMDARVLKGLAVAQLDYPEPDLRITSDIDVLVRPQDIERSIALIAAHGYERHFEEPYPGFDASLGKGAALEGPRRHVIDAHRSLALGFYGVRLPVDRLWAEPESYSLAGWPVAAMPRSARFVHAALHLALAPQPKTMHFLDLPVILASPDGKGQSDAIDVAEAFGCADPVARAVDATIRLFGGAWQPEVLNEWVGHRRTSRRESLWWSTYHGRLAHSAIRSATAIAALRPIAKQPAAAARLVAGRARDSE